MKTESTKYQYDQAKVGYRRVNGKVERFKFT